MAAFAIFVFAVGILIGYALGRGAKTVVIKQEKGKNV